MDFLPFENPFVLAYGMLSSPFVGMAAGLFTFIHAARFATTRTVSELNGVLAGLALLGVYVFASGHWLPAAIGLALCVPAFAWVARMVDQISATVPSVEAVASRASVPEGLDALIAWLQTAVHGQAVPDAAARLVGKVREHVEALKALELPDSQELVAEVSRLVGGDMRDLLVKFRRVEIARKMLPSKATAGDDELVSGLVRVEQAIAAKREALANAVLHDLKVQGRYIELKTDEVN